MVEPPVDPPLCAGASFRPYLEPALRHLGAFGFLLVLAPIIGPRGYGVFVLALSGIAIAEALLNKTVCRALANLARAEDDHWSTTLFALIAAGGAASLAFFAITGPVSSLIGEAGFADMFQSLALLPLLGALAVVPRAILERKGRPAPLVSATAAGLAAGGGVALALAWAGAGPWSLVAQIIVQRFFECAVLWGLVGERVGIAWSRRSFAELIAALDWRALAAAWPAMARFGTCLLIGLTLGPTAAGLYFLTLCVAEAVTGIFLTTPASLSGEPVEAAVRCVCRVVLPAAGGSVLLAIAMPALLDLRWWGAVLPAQILLLGAIPASIIALRGAIADNPAWEAYRQAVQAIAGITLIALAVPHGLTAIAAVTAGWTTAVAAASLWPIRRRLGTQWHVALAAAARPCIGGGAGGLLLMVLVDPVGLRLDTLPALCLLTAAGWLCYLVIRDVRWPAWLRPSAVAVATIPGDANR
jgi:PST family polysaccharide transporter